MPSRFGDPRALALLAALSVSTFAYVTVETLPIGLLPLISSDLNRSASAVGMLVTVYGLVVVLASVPLTRVTQNISRRRVLCVLMAIFVLASVASALAGNYWLLMAARIVTALSQALFWSVVTPAAAALFQPAARPRALSVLYAGSSLGALAGVPFGTWLGQQTNWRGAFAILSGVGLLILIAIVTLMPDTPAGASDADRGWAPDPGRYGALLVYVALAVAGSFTAFTYITTYLIEVTGFGESSLGPLLFLRGLAGLLGVFVVGALVGRNGWLTMTGACAVQLVALALQWTLGESRIATAIAVALSGLALSGLASALGVRILETAPRGSDLALAGASTAFNVGITGGALLGGVLLPAAGIRSTALAGAALTLAALAVALFEPLLSTRRRASRVTGNPTEPTSHLTGPQSAGSPSTTSSPADR